MTSGKLSGDRIRARRQGLSWTQAELAVRGRISRSAVAAIENGRLVPSVAAALGLAGAFGCSVEELFGSGTEPASDRSTPIWAWDPPRPDWRSWAADVGGRTVLYPVESESPTAWIEPDGGGAGDTGLPRGDQARRTLVVACCDPTAGMLARLYEQMTGFRMLVLARSSHKSLELLERGLVHAAGLHLATPEAPQRNVDAIRARFREDCALVRVARWEEGLAVGGQVTGKSLRTVLKSRVRWIGREPGSGAGQCMTERLPATIRPAFVARDHRGVVDAIRSGWADAGVCLRLVCEESGLRFHRLREEFFEFAYRSSGERDPRILGLLRVLRSADYRRLLDGVPGFAAASTGDLEIVRCPSESLPAGG